MNSQPPGSPSSFRSTRPLITPRRHGRKESTDSQRSIESVLSTQSAPVVRPIPIPARPNLPRTGSYQTVIPTSPGRKMAEDMAAAVALAQRTMQTRRSPPSVPLPSLPGSPAASDVSSIGELMLGQSAGSPGYGPTEEDPFEYDAVLGDETIGNLLESTYLNLPDDDEPGPSRSRDVTPRPPNTPRSPRADWQAAPEYPPGEDWRGPRDIQGMAAVMDTYAMPEDLSPSLRPLQLPRHPGLKFSPMIGGGTDIPAAAGEHGVAAMRTRDNPFAQVSRAQNAVAVTWRGHQTQTFALVTSPQAQTAQDARFFSMKVAHGTTQVVEVPPSWEGRVQKLTGGEDEPATWCELVFDGYRGMTFFNVSYAHGNNGPVLMHPWQGREKSGSGLRARHVAPAGICVRDSGGTEVVCGTLQGPSPRRAAVRQFYHNFDFTPAHGAVLPGDDAATQATHEKHIVCDFLPI